MAVQDAAGAAVAAACGADRVELCSALALGGLTPGVGLVEACVDTGLPVHVLVRPRAGGFQYSATEVSVMVREVEAAVDAGARGVVLGALTAAGSLDRHAMKMLVRAAEGREVTVHRCVDVLLADPAGPGVAVLAEELHRLGVTRVLTSGGAPRALEGAPVLTRLAAAAAGDLEVVAGGGVRPTHVPTLRDCGVAAVHLSARTSAADAGEVGPGGGPAGFDHTDGAVVAAAVRAARSSR